VVKNNVKLYAKHHYLICRYAMFQSLSDVVVILCSVLSIIETCFFIQTVLLHHINSIYHHVFFK